MKKPTVLLVNDSEVLNVLHSAVLEAEGFETAVAVDGAQAVEMCLALRPNAVVMDIDMPVMNGIEAMHRLRIETDAGRISRTGVVVTSAHLDDTRRRQCMDAGALAAFQKPIESADFIAAVRAAVAAHQTAGPA